MTVVCFWRGIHMKNPLVDKPLALLSSQSVKREDMVKAKLVGFAPHGDLP